MPRVWSQVPAVWWQQMSVGVRAPEPRVLPPPSTPGASSEAAANRNLGVDVADDAARVVSGANGVAATDVRRGGVVAVAYVASTSTSGANGQVFDNGRLGVVSVGKGRVSPVNLSEGAQVMAVSRSVVSLHSPS